jgi:hypothetical protein
LGPFNDWFRRWCWAVQLDGCLNGLIDEVAQRLRELVNRVTHRCGLGSSVR